MYFGLTNRIHDLVVCHIFVYDEVLVVENPRIGLVDVFILGTLFERRTILLVVLVIRLFMRVLVVRTIFFFLMIFVMLAMAVRLFFSSLPLMILVLSRWLVVKN